jgi:aminoglycoside phosphotransferase (APT) family kinase protein
VATISRRELQKIFDHYELGKVEDFDMPPYGSVNLVVEVNQQYIVRFDTRKIEGISRFRGEQIAYDRLANSPVPVPKVIALDLSKKFVKQNYIILTKVEGSPLVDAWNTLTSAQKYRTAHDAGRFLAHMHNVTYDHFGELRNLDHKRFRSVYDHIYDYFERYAHLAVKQGGMTKATYQRIDDLIQSLRPYLEYFPQGHLVHSDYHFENILQVDGQITGVIDFEWAMGGDPVWDFIQEEKWENQCPSAQDIIMEGYNSVRPLDPRHEAKVHLYKLLMHVETVAVSNDWRGWALERLDYLLAQAEA